MRERLSESASVVVREKLRKSEQFHKKDTGKPPRFSAKLRSVWACGSEGERLTGSQKVVGSSPTRSTSRFYDAKKCPETSRSPVPALL
jgi:hypothetical protein